MEHTLKCCFDVMKIKKKESLDFRLLNILAALEFILSMLQNSNYQK